jgi:hypothetical protein
MKTAIFQFGPRDPFFNDYREEIGRAENISTYVFANAVEIETDKAARTVSHIHAACLEGKDSVSANFFLALGD